MLSMAVGSYSASAVQDALRGIHGRRFWKFRYELLNSSNTKIADLTNVIAGSIEQDSTAEIFRTAKFTVVDDGSINFVSNRIKPWARILMPDGGYAEWPLGVFLLTSPVRKADISGVLTREVDAYDQAMVLRDDTVTSRYYVSSGYNYVTAINDVLATVAGIGSSSITATSLTLPAARDWDPGTSKGKIIYDLLAAINYTPLWWNGAGTAVAVPHVSPAGATASYTYANDDVSLILPDAEQTIDLFGVPNQWVLVVSNPDRPTLRSVVTNTDSASITSTVSRGRTITKVVVDQEAPTQAVLDALAARMAEEDRQIFHTVEFDTGLFPIHEFMDVIQINHSDLGVNVKYEEVKWSMDLTQGASMHHVVQVAVAV